MSINRDTGDNYVTYEKNGTSLFYDIIRLNMYWKYDILLLTEVNFGLLFMYIEFFADRGSQGMCAKWKEYLGTIT